MSCIFATAKLLINASQRVTQFVVGFFYGCRKFKRFDGLSSLALFEEDLAQQAIGFGRLRVKYERSLHTLPCFGQVPVLFICFSQIIMRRRILRIAFKFEFEGRYGLLVLPQHEISQTE